MRAPSDKLETFATPKGAREVPEVQVQWGLVYGHPSRLEVEWQEQERSATAFHPNPKGIIATGSPDRIRVEMYPSHFVLLRFRPSKL